MKKGIWLFLAIARLAIGVLAVASFLILAIGGEPVLKWIPAALLGIAHIVLAVFDFAEYRSKE